MADVTSNALGGPPLDAGVDAGVLRRTPAELRLTACMELGRLIRSASALDDVGQALPELLARALGARAARVVVGGLAVGAAEAEVTRRHPIHEGDGDVGYIGLVEPTAPLDEPGAALCEHVAAELAALHARLEIARADELLRRSDERHRALLSVLTQVVWTANAGGAFVTPQSSWEAYTGQRWDEHRGMGWLEALHPDDRDGARARWSRAATSPAVWEATGRIWHARTGTWRWFVARAAPLTEPEGRVREWVGTVTDIDDQCRAERDRDELVERATAARALAERERSRMQAVAAALEATSRAKDEFLATVSHELRTPLSSILGWAALLRERRDDPATILKGADVIHRNARAQAKIIEDILDVSRIITGKLRLDARPVDLETVVRDALEVVRPSAVAKGIDLTVEGSAGEPYVLIGDEERLRQVVWNLLSNAVKFTDRGGRIVLRTARGPSSVTISVEDTGRGIAPEFLPHVFERFRQADSSTTRAQGGLGLGLAIVRHLVELHGGQVSVRSEGPARGATFAVSLPLRVSTSAIPSERPTSRGSAPSSSGSTRRFPSSTALDGLRVLVVDDEEDARDMVAITLESWGAHVVTASGVEEALARIADWAPDVLVSDIGMPEADGYTLVRRLREIEGKHLPAVALTAYARAEDAERALTTGFDFHVAKPIEPDDLRDVVERAAHLAGRA